jgi:S-adenosylmethionine-diacylglycerol 3-amino-3-carboxypropyl transferase
MTALALQESRVRSRASHVDRSEVGGTIDGRLFFAQVREDPCVEIAALRPGGAGRIVAVSSGGCTALSLLGAGAREVHSVDVIRAQNHLVELKAAAVRTLDRRAAIAFLGGLPAAGGERLRAYAHLRDVLTAPARAFWDSRRRAVRGGVLRAGVSERFIALVSWLVRHVVHDPARVHRLLACRTLDEQRALFVGEWSTRRWRWLFDALLNRWTMSRAYDPAFFANAGLPSFAAHFRTLAERALTELPVANNYFLHEMLEGRYPVAVTDGVPPYLGEEGARDIASGRGTLRLVDGGMTEHLRSLPDASVDGIALSNICEWLAPADVLALFREIERVTVPGGRVVLRNFVGFTALPRECARIEEDVAFGAALARTDRSMVQYRVVVARVRGGR